MKSFLRDTRIVSIGLTVAFGFVWGLIEMSLGGFLHAIHFPLKGVVLGGIGVALMISFVSLTRRPLLVFWLGGIAAFCKLLGAILLGLSPISAAVINPAGAILLEALAFQMIAAFFLWNKSLPAMVPGRPGDID